MRVLIDTNILADLLLGRDPYYYIAYDILTMCADQKVYGYIAAHSIPNLFYILRKSMTKEERREALKDICLIKNSCYSSRWIFNKISINVYIENCKKISMQHEVYRIKKAKTCSSLSLSYVFLI